MDISDMDEYTPSDLRRLLEAQLLYQINQFSIGHGPKLLLPKPTVEPEISEHAHPVPELFFQIIGESLLQSSHETITLEPGDLLIIAPEVTHVEIKAPGSVNIVAKIPGPQLLYHRSEGGQDGQMHFQYDCIDIQPFHSPNANLMDACRIISETEDHEMALPLIEVALRIILHQTRHLDTQLPEQSDLLRRCQRQALLDLGNPDLNVSSLAVACDCHPDHLSRLARQQWGISLQRWLIQMRMQRAILLLESTEKLIFEIANECGYEDQQYFARAFRKEFKLSPSAYRRRMGPVTFQS